MYTICDKELSYLGEQRIYETTVYLEAKHLLQYYARSKPTTGCTMMEDFVRRIKCSEAHAKKITDRVSQMIVQDLNCQVIWNLVTLYPVGRVLKSDINHKFKTYN